MSGPADGVTLADLLARARGQPPIAAIEMLRRELETLDAPSEALVVLAATILQTASNEIGPTRAIVVEKAIDSLDGIRTTRAAGSGRLASATLSYLSALFIERMLGTRRDNVDRALKLSEEAAQAVSKSAHPDMWGIARLASGHALFTRATEGAAETSHEDLEGAITAFRQAERVLAPISQSMSVNCQLDLAMAYERRIVGGRVENFERAAQYCRRALETVDRRSDPKVWSYAQNQLGHVLLTQIQGDRKANARRARRAFEEALTARAPGTREWAVSMTNLASTLAIGRDFEGARRCYRLALRVRTREALPLQWAQTLDGLANVEAEDISQDPVARFERAIGYWQSILEIYKASEQPVWRARMLEKIAIALGRLAVLTPSVANARRAEAAIMLSEALAILGPGTAFGDALRIARQLARISEQAGAWAIACDAYRLTLISLEVVYNAAVVQRGRETELAAADGWARAAAYAYARVGDLREAVTILEQFRARRLGDLLARDRADLTRLGSDYPDLHSRFAEVVEQVRNAEAEDARAAPNAEPGQLEGLPGSGQSPSGGRAQMLQQDLDSVLDLIRRTPGNERFLEPPGFDDVASAVTVDRPIAYLVETEHGSVALAVFRSASSLDTNVVAVWGHKLTTSDMRRMLVATSGEEVVGGYLLGQVGHTGHLKTALAELLPLLGRALISPLAEQFITRGARAVALVPCGLFGALPIHAADVALIGVRSQCLLDVIDVQYAASARALTAGHPTSREASTSGGKFVGIANPRSRSGRSLTFAEPEVEEVAGILSAMQSRLVLRGAEATRQALVESLPGVTHLHLACHGVVDIRDPLGSRLLLAGDDVISVRDLIASPSGSGKAMLADARLVVASACDSAVTDMLKIPDEVVGLPAGFLQAGADGVVGTLWTVNDLPCAILMVRFYELLAGRAPACDPVDPPGALNAAQRWLRDLTGAQLAVYAEEHPALVAAGGKLLDAIRAQPGHMPYSSPIYWAPYVYFGA